MKPINKIIPVEFMYALPLFSLPYYDLNEYHIPYDASIIINHQKFLLPMNTVPQPPIKNAILIMKLLAKIGVGLSIILWLVSLLSPEYYFDKSYPYLAILSIVLFYIVDIADNLNNHKQSMILFDRVMGIAHIPIQQQSKKLTVDFERLSAYISNQLYGYKEPYHYLLIKMSSNSKAYPIYKSKSKLDLILLWSFLQYFMDTLKALPDVPALEPYRNSDQLTAKYDQLSHRTHDCWRKKTKEQVIDLIETARVSIIL